MVDESRQADLHCLRQRARGGDSQALGELLQQDRPYHSLLARLMEDRQLQSKLSDSDLVQDTCLSAYCDFAQFRHQTRRLT